MSGSLPYMPFYVADYLADTNHLTTVEHGAYLLLLMNYWQRGGPLPADDHKLSRIVRMSLKDWLKVKATVAEFFACGEATWQHKRVERELEYVATKRQQASNAGRISAQRKLNGRSTDVQRTFNPGTQSVATDPPPNFNHTRVEESRVEKSREENKEDGATAPPDARTILFSEGLSCLSHITGKPAASCRPLLGRWLKEAKDDCSQISVLIAQAKERRVVDAVGWIEAAIKNNSTRKFYEGSV